MVQEVTVADPISSIGLIEKRPTCPRCYSNEIEKNEKTIKCFTCKSRTVCSKENIDESQIKLTIIDLNRQSFELIIDISKVQELLEQCNYKELSKNNLVEDENVLVALSSINVCVAFNTQNKHINSIAISNMQNELNNTS
ncbi:unnamed protein product [Rotaria sp. Silwood2]|nr:unnamed protein product [Rotaria sp. Silwood2]CAF4744780.1 unnamed protein product [Rotaria sp. Silwood2]